MRTRETKLSLGLVMAFWGAVVMFFLAVAVTGLAGWLDGWAR